MTNHKCIFAIHFTKGYIQSLIYTTSRFSLFLSFFPPPALFPSAGQPAPFPPILKDFSLDSIFLTSYCPIFYSSLQWNSWKKLSPISFLSFSFKLCQSTKTTLVKTSTLFKTAVNFSPCLTLLFSSIWCRYSFSLPWGKKLYLASRTSNIRL